MCATQANSAVDTLVVGGGIVGVAIAYYLAHGGLDDVLLVEAEELGAGATGKSFAGVRQQFSTPLEIELSKLGLQFWKTATDQFDSPCPFNQTGYLFVTSDPTRLQRLTEAAALQRSLSAGPVHMLGPDRIPDVVPWMAANDLAGGCWTPDDGRVNGPDGVAALAKGARQHGVEIRQHWPVARIQRRPRGGFDIASRTGDVISANRLVVAAGLAAPALMQPLGYDVDVFPIVVHHALTEPVLQGETLPLTIDFDTGFCVEREGPGIVASMLTDDPPGTYSQQQMLADWYSAASVRAPSLIDVGITHLLTAAADGVSDGHPNAGQMEENLWLLAGFAGHGVMHGPVIARLIGEQILGTYDRTLDLSPMDPRRDRSRHEGEEWMVGQRQ